MRITKAHDYDLTGELAESTGLEAGPYRRRRATSSNPALKFLDAVPDLPEKGPARRSLHSVLQRPLPDHRFWETGVGEVRDLIARRSADV
jgi:hypothetical protein